MFGKIIGDSSSKKLTCILDSSAMKLKKSEYIIDHELIKQLSFLHVLFFLCVDIHVFIQFMIFQVTTDDGYILGVQRIPEGRVGGGGQNRHRQPVLLQHGVLVVSCCNILLLFRKEKLYSIVPISIMPNIN